MANAFPRTIQLDQKVMEKYDRLDQNGKVQLEYVWIDVNGQEFRSRTIISNVEPNIVEEVPRIVAPFDILPNLDVEDVTLTPVALYPDPFQLGPNKIVFCETYYEEKTPTRSNHRHECALVTEKSLSHDAWIGFEQEYHLLDNEGNPFGWQLTPGGKSFRYAPQKSSVPKFHSANGTENVRAREIIRAHTKACLYMGIELFGTNTEADPSQFEYQTGPSIPLKAADDLWMSRFLLKRVAEDFGVIVTFDPKPFDSADLHTNGCHTNFSTKSTRSSGGIKAIEAAMQKMSLVHLQHLTYCDTKGGKDNRRRLTGEFPVPKYEEFSYSNQRIGSTIRIPSNVQKNGCGYFEDRRPSSNCDPYMVITALLRTVCLEGEDSVLQERK